MENTSRVYTNADTQPHIIAANKRLIFIITPFKKTKFHVQTLHYTAPWLLSPTATSTDTYEPLVGENVFPPLLSPPLDLKHSLNSERADLDCLPNIYFSPFFLQCPLEYSSEEEKKKKCPS